ncbi:MAG: GTP cyclohydrolase I FolE [Ardenticatenales bacterium]|nr:GTP cyclohydrolase I FolE [Ardenticatenales bacterium]
MALPAANGREPVRLPTGSAAEIESLVARLLSLLGEDAARDGLQKTPHRVAKMYREMLSGYGQDIETILNGALFEVAYGDGEMIVVADIGYQSMCEHHMLPFTGRAHVAYIPRDRVVGLSKIPRLVDMFARRLQIQERLTNEIADSMVAALDPVGVMVVLDGEHTCASLRGVKKHGVNMITTARRGAFKHDPTLRDEFYRLIGR